MKILIVLSLFLINTGTAAAQNRVKMIEDFKQMAGCWQHRDSAKKLLISEMWMSPAGTSIIGMGRTVKKGTTTGWEYMRIEQRADGFYFVSRPNENSEDTEFKLISSTVNQVVFENKLHDFPQRVIYKVSRTRMTGRIEGINAGKFMGINFPMTRVKCG